jgi:tetratricopeptide (TPR) repeat protein
MLGPLNELYPFPQPRQQATRMPLPKTEHLIHKYSLKMKEVECKTKIKNTGLLDRAKMIDLVEDMRSIAYRHYELEHFHLAENWWRRVVDYSRKISGYQPAKVLEACLWVIDNFRLQGKFTESRHLHQGVHKKMMSLFHPEHELMLLSKSILCFIFSNLGEYQLEEELQRELVQVVLSRCGAKSQLLASQLGVLGLTLFSNGKVKEAETILCLYIQLDREISEYADKCQADKEHALCAMCDLAEVLNGQERYGESSKILDFAEAHFKELLMLGSYLGNNFYRRKAEALHAQGDLLGCEELLRTILEHTTSSIGWDSVNSMELLAELLGDTGRATEALSWREKVFLMDIQLCGIEHRWSRKDCKTLGFCYAKLGRYDDAINHSNQTIQKLSLDQGVNLESRSEYIETLHQWILEVEEMQGKSETGGEGSNLENTQLGTDSLFKLIYMTKKTSDIS